MKFANFDTTEDDIRGGGCGVGGHRRRRRGFGRGRKHCADPDALTLSDVAPGTTCTIRRLRGHGPARQRLLDLGFQPGRTVKMLRNAPLNDPIEVQLGDTFIALRRREATHVAIHGPQDDPLADDARAEDSRDE